MTPDRLAIDPLWRHVERRWQASHEADADNRQWGAVIFGCGQLGKAVGVERHVVRRWQRKGLTVWEADRAAVAAGVHPANLWPEWWALCDESEVA